MDLTEQQPVKKTRAVWKKVLIGIPAILLLLIVVAFLTAWLLEDKIKQKIVTEVNKQVTVPIQVKGGINFSLLKHFPYASLTFEEVSVDDRLQGGNKKLLSVNEFSFLCNIYSLFGNQIEFSKILIRNGELNLYKDESGKNNYAIFKKADAGSKNDLSVQLKKAEIKGVKFTYLDRTQNVNISVKLTSVLLKGNFSDEQFELYTKSKIHVNRAIVNGDDFLNNRDMGAEISLLVDKAKNKFTFSKGNISLDETEFSITGFFAQLKAGTQLNFKLVNEGKDVQKLIALLPEKYKANLASADGTGQYSITATVNGMVGKNSFPKVDVTADLKDSEIKLGTYNKLLKNVNASAKYQLDENGESKIIISNFNCTLNSLPFNFRLSLTHLADPTFDFYANGVLHLTEVAAFVPDSVVQDIDGTITFNNFHLKGCKRDFTTAENSTLTGSGDFKLSEVEFRQNGITYGNINGLLKYENQAIEAQGFTFNFLSTDFTFTGRIENLFAYIYNLSVKRRANDVVLGIDGHVKTKTFNLTNILDTYDRKNRPAEQRKEKINIREIFNMQGNLQVEMERFLFRKMEFADLSTSLRVTPGNIQIYSLRTRAMGGEVRTVGNIEFTPANALAMKIDITAVDLNIPQIFRECENFNQTTLTDKNLKGTISTAIALDATWKNYKELDTKTLSAIIDFSIKNGELINFEPLRAASKFIRMEELEDIRFAELANTIKIANERFDVPEFEIKTSALNLMFFGFHYFNNDIDYHFKINLHKLLAQKFNRAQRDVQYIEEDPYEGVNLYLTMTGNLSNPKIKFDKPAARNKMINDFRNEKEVLKGLLKNTPRVVDAKEQRREDKYFDTREEPKFMDFDTTDN